MLRHWTIRRAIEAAERQRLAAVRERNLAELAKYGLSPAFGADQPPTSR